MYVCIRGSLNTGPAGKTVIESMLHDTVRIFYSYLSKLFCVIFLKKTTVLCLQNLVSRKPMLKLDRG